MKKRKLFAPFLMLFAGAVASIMMFAFHYTTAQMLPRLLGVLLFFYIAGCFIQKKVIGFEKEIEEKEAAEGEAIEKEVPEEDADGKEKEEPAPEAAKEI